MLLSAQPFNQHAKANNCQFYLNLITLEKYLDCGYNMPPAARLTDLTACPMVTPGTPPVPHVGGPIIGPCSQNVIICGLPAARVTDKSQCVGPTDLIIKGSINVLINGLMAARIGDPTVHGGKIITGCPTVLIGEKAPSVPLTLGSEGIGNAVKQSEVLAAAANNGTPFCETCNR